VRALPPWPDPCSQKSAMRRGGTGPAEEVSLVSPPGHSRDGIPPRPPRRSFHLSSVADLALDFGDWRQKEPGVSPRLRRPNGPARVSARLWRLRGLSGRPWIVYVGKVVAGTVGHDRDGLVRDVARCHVHRRDLGPE